MRLFITGATGLIGRRLVVDRLERGDQVVILSRNSAKASKTFAADVNRNISVVQGNPAAPGSWQDAINSCDAVIHLAGAGLADRRWTAAYKREIRSSRVDSTHQIINAIEQANQKPRLLINGSAVGFYPDAADKELDERDKAGVGYLADVCRAWEEQAALAEQLGVRVVLLRMSVVLDNRGGALAKMTLPFRFFAGGPLGTGKQFIPWIHWRDLLGIIDLAIQDSSIQGPLNAASPNPVRQRELASAIGSVMNRPSWLPAPRIALRVGFGEIAQSLTASQRVIPRKALERNYTFLYPEIESAVRSLLRPDDEQANDNRFASSEDSGAVPAALGGAHHDFKPSRPIKLVAVAVDGTLLNQDGSIAQAVVQSCRAAARAGVAIVLATARPPRACRAILQTLDLDYPTINYNGAAIWDPRRDEPQYEEMLQPLMVREIIDVVRALNAELSFQIEARDRWYIDRIDSRLFPNEQRALEPDGIGSLDPHLQSPVARLSIVGFPEQVQTALAVIRDRYWRKRAVAVFLPDPRVIQISHPMVDKAIALQRLIRRMSIVREEVMTIGDSASDMGMIEWAGLGVAVDNAPAGVKKLAKAIVQSNDELGVAKALQRFVLAGRPERQSNSA